MSNRTEEKKKKAGSVFSMMEVREVRVSQQVEETVTLVEECLNLRIILYYLC